MSDKMSKKAGHGVQSTSSEKPPVNGFPNLLGRPRAYRDVVVLARTHTEDAIRALAEIATDRDCQPSARVAACQALLDRGWGKSKEKLDITHTYDVASLPTHKLEEMLAKATNPQAIDKIEDLELPEGIEAAIAGDTPDK